MTELSAQPFASFVIGKIGDLLVREEKFLGGVSGQVLEMETEIRKMQFLLAHADARREESEIVQDCVDGFRELVYDAEDIIDAFVIKVAFRRRTGFLNVLMRFSCIVKDSFTRRKVRIEIKSIKSSISSMRASLEMYGERRVDESSWSSRYERQRQLRQSYPHIMEDDIVGMDEDLKTIVEHLVKNKRQCRVVSICGMGGLGKTTLAKMVYNHVDVRRHFDCFAWAYISQHCKPREVLAKILTNLLSPISIEEREEIEKLKLDELAEKLLGVQSQKKCLVILDDICEARAWDSLSPSFPNTKRAVGSKILVTTRNREVALYMDHQVYLHELRHLTERESWELFVKKVSQGREGTEFGLNAQMMETLGKEMVRHCGGLPLAILLLGGVLATKHKMDEWEMVSGNIDYYLRKSKSQGVPMQDILALSYHDLPYHLKACFLCFSHLPEDEGIRPEELVQKWMAEGFVLTQVGEVEELTMLDVGMSYLDELVERCIVQVQLTRFSQRVKFCRLHDLMRDLCLLKAREENFLKVVYMGGDSDSSSSSLSSSTTIRRLSAHYLGNRGSGSDSTGREYENHHRHVRSCQFYFFGNKLKDFDWQQIESLLEGFKVLKILDLQRAAFSGEEKTLPRAVGNLIHLRYLSVAGSDIRGLPSSIGNLRLLQTLDLRARCISNTFSIPNILWRLEQLKHLYLPETIIEWPLSISSKLRLDGLRKLETLEGFNTKYMDVSCVSKLANLRKLGVTWESPKDLAVILRYPILSDSNLIIRYSSFSIFGNFQTQEEQSLLSELFGCHHLHKLNLSGSLNRANFPSQFPPNLTKLTLRWSKLELDPMPTLGKFPNLRSLALEWLSYSGKVLVCSAPSPTATSSASGGGFPQLRFLRLYGIRNLEEWRVEEGAMPILVHLEISSCPELKEIPDGLKSVTTLQELVITGVSQQIKDRLREGGQDFYKVLHVPSITIN